MMDEWQAISSPPGLIVLLGVGGILVWHLIPRSKATARLLAQFAFFVPMTAVLVVSGMTPVETGPSALSDRLAVAAKLLWWVHLAWAVIGLVRIYLVLGGRPREASLIQDLAVGVIYLGVGLSILAYVFAVPVGTLVATSGVVAIILGLALQNTLADLFAGIALSLGSPFVIGDWIVLSDGTEGQVAASNWRATQLHTSANNLVVLPNSMLAKLGLTNVSRPDGTHLIGLTVRLRATRAPSTALEAARRALASSNIIIQRPAPVVALKAIDALALEIELIFRVPSPTMRVQARSEVLELVLRHCRSQGLALAPPENAITDMRSPGEAGEEASSGRLVGLFEDHPILRRLDGEDRRRLAEAAQAMAFPAGETIILPSELSRSWFMLRAGVVAFGNAPEEQARFAPGDVLAATDMLAGPGDSLRLDAVTDVEIALLDSKVIASTRATHPRLEAELLEALSAQTRAQGAFNQKNTEHPGAVGLLLRSVQKRLHSESIQRV